MIAPLNWEGVVNRSGLLDGLETLIHSTSLIWITLESEGSVVSSLAARIHKEACTGAARARWMCTILNNCFM
jgi:hypothetical protein